MFFSSRGQVQGKGLAAAGGGAERSRQQARDQPLPLENRASASHHHAACTRMESPGPISIVMFADHGGNVRRNKGRTSSTFRRSGIIAMKDDEGRGDRSTCRSARDDRRAADGCRRPSASIHGHRCQGYSRARNLDGRARHRVAKSEQVISLTIIAPHGRRCREVPPTCVAPMRLRRAGVEGGGGTDSEDPRAPSKLGEQRICPKFATTIRADHQRERYGKRSSSLAYRTTGAAARHRASR